MYRSHPQLRETASLPHADYGTVPEWERVLMAVQWDLIRRDAHLRSHPATDGLLGDFASAGK
jgi:hypothetical protein